MKVKFGKLLSAVLFLCVANSAKAGIIVDFIVDGDTYTQPWTITNNSTAGEMIESFVFDLRPLSTYCFDISTSDCNTSSGTPFAPVVGSGATGYTSASVTDEPGGLAFRDFLRINFSDFGMGETFSWDLDVDSESNVTVFGNELIGSTVYVQMSDGNTYFGNLEEVVDNADAARFVISGAIDKPIDDIVGVPEPTSVALLALGLLGFASRRAK